VAGGNPQDLAEAEKNKGRHETWLPQFAWEEVPKYLATADVVVIPQRQTQGTVGQMPAKIFDAMAKPIISTRVSDIPEVLDGSGYLVDSGHTEQLCETLSHVLDHLDEAQERGQKARARCIEHYDLSVLEERLLPQVEDVISRSRA
jgi:glycosyltransferase involved in cell wall biosynthesis